MKSETSPSQLGLKQVETNGIRSSNEMSNIFSPPLLPFIKFIICIFLKIRAESSRNDCYRSHSPMKKFDRMSGGERGQCGGWQRCACECVRSELNSRRITCPHRPILCFHGDCAYLWSRQRGRSECSRCERRSSLTLERCHQPFRGFWDAPMRSTR